ncbi:MAG: hypothetical protein V7723_07580, partial [Sneathiella sp.]|uniref:hypothetical protein n=1 Tax=Sneathiella sp. TaxID=1964365 RepID=UPI003002201B
DKLTGKVKGATKRADKATEELEAAKEQIAVLKLAVDSNTSKPEPKEPNPEEFELGYEDPEYRQALRTYNAYETKKTVDKSLEVQEAKQQQEATRQRNEAKLEENAKAHYQRAAKLKVSDYGKVEDVALEKIGTNLANIIINNFEESELILFHLGKNEDTAEELVELATSNPVMAIRKLDKIVTGIKPAKRTTTTPEPDDLVQSGAPSRAESARKKYDRLLEKAQDSSNTNAMNELRVFRKKMKAKGITFD